MNLDWKKYEEKFPDTKDKNPIEKNFHANIDFYNKKLNDLF